MKALETHFMGYRFRSRLEARWAVFFEAMGWSYQYEPEGFVLPDGTPYLPDFYLPDFDRWVEIKGEYPTAKEQQIALEFTKTGRRYVLFYGPCGHEEHSAFSFQRQGGEWVAWDEQGCGFAACCRCEIGVWLRSEHAATLWLDCNPHCETDRWPIATRAMFDAYTRAKGARFEHGERP